MQCFLINTYLYIKKTTKNNLKKSFLFCISEYQIPPVWECRVGWVVGGRWGPAEGPLCARRPLDSWLLYFVKQTHYSIFLTSSSAACSSVPVHWPWRASPRLVRPTPRCMHPEYAEITWIHHPYIQLKFHPIQDTGCQILLHFFTFTF